jgi:hypothetical protein
VDLRVDVDLLDEGDDLLGCGGFQLMELGGDTDFLGAFDLNVYVACLRL